MPFGVAYERDMEVRLPSVTSIVQEMLPLTSPEARPNAPADTSAVIVTSFSSISYTAFVNELSAGSVPKVTSDSPTYALSVLSSYMPEPWPISLRVFSLTVSV